MPAKYRVLYGTAKQVEAEFKKLAEHYKQHEIFFGLSFEISLSAKGKTDPLWRVLTALDNGWPKSRRLRTAFQELARKASR